MLYEMGDKIYIKNKKGKWFEGTIINYNKFREFHYAIQVDGFSDVVFASEDDLMPYARENDLVYSNIYNDIFKVKVFDNGKSIFRDKDFDKYNGDLYLKFEEFSDTFYSYINLLTADEITKIWRLDKEGNYKLFWEKGELK